jgi:predicted PurR-regulated permease PerM
MTGRPSEVVTGVRAADAPGDAATTENPATEDAATDAATDSVTDPRFHLPARRVLILAVLVVALLWLAQPVLMPFVLAVIIAYAFGPYIDAVQARTGRSRFLIVLLLYGTGLIIVGALVVAFSGPILRELQLLSRAGPDAVQTALRQLLGGDSLTIGDRTITVEELSAQLQAALTSYLQTPEGAIRAAQQVLHGTLDTVLTIIVTFYLLLDGIRFRDMVLAFLDPRDRSQLIRVGRRVHVVVGKWLRGQMILVVLVGVIVTVVLGLVLKLPYPLALGLLVGLLEVITFIGPLIAGTIVAIVALSSGGVPLAITAVVFLFVLRQVEDVLVMPFVLGRAVKLHPLAALFAVVVGATAFGILGTFLAVPVAAAVNVALHEFFPEELGPLNLDEPRGKRGKRTPAAVADAAPVRDDPIAVNAVDKGAELAEDASRG